MELFPPRLQRRHQGRRGRWRSTLAVPLSDARTIALVTLVGLDLAWTAGRPSGWCVLREVRGEVCLAALESICLPAQAFSARLTAFEGDVVAAIDAPLRVAEPRLAEKQLNAVYGRYKAGAYLATRQFLEQMDAMAGPLLGDYLSAAGFDTFPSFLWDDCPRPARVAFEMYPHAAHVELFPGLAERIPYKKGVVAARRAGLGEYQARLAALLAIEAPGVLEAPEVARLLSGTALASRGTALKAVEDQLDALTCALVAWHAWRFGAAGMRVFGDENGYIAVPRLPTSVPEPTSPSG